MCGDHFLSSSWVVLQWLQVFLQCSSLRLWDSHCQRPWKMLCLLGKTPRGDSALASVPKIQELCLKTIIPREIVPTFCTLTVSTQKFLK